LAVISGRKIREVWYSWTCSKETIETESDRWSENGKKTIFTEDQRGARGSVVGWGTMLQTGGSPVQVPDKVDFFNPSSRTMALGSTQTLTEMSTRNLPGG
jgi:hypothetical protein